MTRNEQRKLNRKKRLATLLVNVAVDNYNDNDLKYFSEFIGHASILFHEIGLENEARLCVDMIQNSEPVKFHHRPYIGGRNK